MIKKLSLALSAAAVMCMAGVTAKADPALPGISNGDFTQYTGVAPKAAFINVAPTGWTGNSAGLTFVDSQVFAQSAAGPVYLQTYGNPTGPITGNYVEADGNPDYSGSFSYQLTGLTKGQTYTLGFYEAASQQTGYSGATTNQWIVSLGTKANGLVTYNSGGGYDSYKDTDANASIAASTLMNVASKGTTNWQYVTVNLTADATSDYLSFLAWGNNGQISNAPPIAFLADVGATGVPEPATWGLMILGLAALGATARRRRALALA
jgi:hypothetical protein